MVEKKISALGEVPYQGHFGFLPRMTGSWRMRLDPSIKNGIPDGQLNERMNLSKRARSSFEHWPSP